MKKSIYLMTSIVSVSLLVVSGMSAQAVVLADNTGSSNSESTNTTSNESKDLQERLTERKTELKLKLTTVEQLRIKNRCVQAQTGGIKSLSGRIKGIETSRNEVYTNLSDRLNKLIVKLKAKGIDTSTLESEIATLKTKIDTFKADLATYKQDVGDLEGMNCASDPVAFKASITTGRTERQKLFKDVVDIRSYLNNTIKPTLKSIRSQIEAKDKTSTDTNKASNNTTEGNQ